MTEMSHLMTPFGNKIANFNKVIRSVGTDICARREDLGNLLSQLFETYTDCSSDNEPFTC